MKAKVWLTGCVTAAVLGTLISGCSNSVETGEKIITIKDENSGEEGGITVEELEQDRAAERGSLGEIAEQVQAPEHYTADFSVGSITVKVDAQVVIPAGEGFKTYRVTGRPFEQKDYDRVCHVLMKDAGLWTLEFVEMPAVVTVDTGERQEPYPETGWLSGYATVDGTDYLLSIDNRFTEDFHWCNFRITKKEEEFGDELGSYPEYYSFSGLSDEQKENAGFSIDEIRDKAMEDVTAMGFTDFVPSGEEYYALYADVQHFSSIQEAVRKVGYGIHFTRNLEGVPETYTVDLGADGDRLVWPYEKLTLVYDKEGLVNFSWGNPYEVEKVSDEYLFLLPFAEIQNIFEEMIIKKYQNWMDGNDNMKMDFEVNEVRLGYMRVREKGNSQEAAMVPVWDFIGTQKVTYDGDEVFYDERSAFASALTINALDGTIIDRELGY